MSQVRLIVNSQSLDTQIEIIMLSCSCFGPHRDLDSGVEHGRHTEEFTEALINNGFSVRQLWQEYGIHADIIVS